MKISMKKAITLGLVKILGRVPSREELKQFLCDFSEKSPAEQRYLACGAAIDCDIPIETWGWQLPPELQVIFFSMRQNEGNRWDKLAEKSLSVLLSEESFEERLKAGKTFLFMLWNESPFMGTKKVEAMLDQLKSFFAESPQGDLQNSLREYAMESLLANNPSEGILAIA